MPVLEGCLGYGSLCVSVALNGESAKNRQAQRKRSQMLEGWRRCVVVVEEWSVPSRYLYSMENWGSMGCVWAICPSESRLLRQIRGVGSPKTWECRKLLETDMT